MDKRILAVLIAAMAGSAYAQSGYVTGNDSRPVLNSGGGYWTSSGSAPATAAPAAAAPARQQLAQSGPGSDRARGVAGNASSAGTPAPSSLAPQNDAYLTDAGTRGVVVNSAGHCVRTGAWTPDKAAAPCDEVVRASTPAPVVAAAPEPAPAPALQEAPRPVIEKVTLNTDVLFPFNKAELLPGGRDKLDELAKDSQGSNVDKVVIAGYADRIGSEEYNKDLSERRAQAVADYLASKGVDQSKLEVEGHGKDNPVTGDQCANMGRENAKNQKLIACLQPDRRVEAELLGSREVAGTTTAPAGATSSGTSGSSSGTGESGSTSTR